jgi:hypothetical protein
MACKSKKGKMRIPSRKMSVGGILSSTAGMAGTGATFGSVGAGIGAAAGLGIGIYQHLQEQEVEKKQQEQLAQQRRINNIYNTTEFTTGRGMELMPYGGNVGNSTVELEQGEVFRTPDGQMQALSTQAPSHAQGGVTMNLPNGTQVLGKKELMAQGKQFKDLGRKLNKTQEKYMKSLESNPTSIASTTAKRMLSNVQKQFDALFQMQGEDTATTFGNGGTTPSSVNSNRSSVDLNARGVYTDVNNDPYRSSYATPLIQHPNVQNQFYPVQNTMRNLQNPDVFPVDTVGNNINYGSYKGPSSGGANTIDYKEAQILEYLNEDSKSKNRVTYAKGGKVIPKYYGPNKENNYDMTIGSNSGLFPGTNMQFPGTGPALVQAPDMGSGLWPMEDINTVSGNTPLQPNVNSGGAYNFKQGTVIPNTTFSPKSVNWSSIGSTAASLAPVLDNLFAGKPEQMNPQDFYNPYEGQVRNAMSNRRYNIQPELEQNRLNQATYYRNLAEAAPSQAQMLGGMQAGSIAKQRADSAAIAMKQNVDNQYLGEQAQMDAQLGSQKAQTNFNISDINARNRAASRNIRNAGMTQVSQFAQNKEQMNNQILRDAQRLGLLEDLIANYKFEGGKWKSKATGEEVSAEEVSRDLQNYVKGNK